MPMTPSELYFFPVATRTENITMSEAKRCEPGRHHFLNRNCHHLYLTKLQQPLEPSAHRELPDATVTYSFKVARDPRISYSIEIATKDLDFTPPSYRGKSSINGIIN